MGVDFVLKADEEFPMKVGYDRFLKAVDAPTENP
jgi:hypothetical protein